MYIMGVARLLCNCTGNMFFAANVAKCDQFHIFVDAGVRAGNAAGGRTMPESGAMQTSRGGIHQLEHVGQVRRGMAT